MKNKYTIEHIRVEYVTCHVIMNDAEFETLIIVLWEIFHVEISN